jgi:hypothetical protein
MIRSASRLILVLVAAAAIAVFAGGFSWDGTPDMAAVNGQSTNSSGGVTIDGFSWDDGTASPVAASG